MSVGQALGHAVGSLAEYVPGIALVVLGAYLVFADDDDAEKTSALTRTRGFAIIGLGIGISLDELAIGISVGLLRLAIVWAIVLTAAQALLVALLEMRLGSRIRERFRARIEKVAGLALIALGALVLAIWIPG